MSKNNFLRSGRERTKKDLPYVRLEQAARRFAAQRIDDGKNLAQAAIDLSKYAATPVGIYSKAIDLLVAHDQEEAAGQILQKGLALFPDDRYLQIQQTRFLLRRQEVTAATQNAQRVLENFPDDPLAKVSLANCYMADEKTPEAIGLLEPLYTAGIKTTSVTGALASAYVLMKNRKKFETLVPETRESARLIFNKASLCYIEGDTRKAHELLKPLLRTARAYPNTIGLYLACIDEANPLFDALRRSVDEKIFERALTLRKQWLENPVRAATLSQPFFYASSQTMWAEGAYPASTQDRKATGATAGETPVSVRGHRVGKPGFPDR